MVKRRLANSPPPKGLAAGQVLRREVLSSWGWVGAEVTDSSLITRDHLLATCGLSRRNNNPFCRNQYQSKSRRSQSSPSLASPDAIDSTPDGVIVISDGEDDRPLCGKKGCKTNPNCLNYLGQDKWKDEDSVMEHFLQYAKLGENPLLLAKDPELPVGLKNLGATCYANASLQVWFRDPAFRTGVYNCQPLEGSVLPESIFQLQVTFAALQESIQNVFNPTKLVESLHLRTTEQQDAQEFSKLFMTHLDAEFKKQPDPSLRSLINSQFEGEQIYGTLCNNCQFRSERSSHFLELEVNFQNNSKLEDCIEVLLEPESLTGDNKYFCVQCDSLQDATRYTELRRLPPVLHFSLLRFVYDLKTMERKKSKSTIVFPKVLAMDQFLGSSSERRASQESCNNIYELRGILLHKGPSAYHGHYEAQVFDSQADSWYQFNDEEVTRIDKLGDKRATTSKKVEIVVEDTGNGKDDEKPTGSKRKKTMNASRKRQRVDDSEDETPPDIHSKDAYMLIYALRQSDPEVLSNIEITAPPHAMNVVDELNASHDRECERFEENEKSARAALRARRAKIMEIYENWSVSSANEDCIIVSQQALQEWLTHHSAAGLFAIDKSADATMPPRTQILVNDILCEHGGLDHNKAGFMKRVSREAYNTIVESTNCIFEPTLSLDDVCSICVHAAFKERLYHIEHPQLVAQFNEKLKFGDERSGYWISKAWLKDWTLQKPKMHVASEDDPPPDSPDFASDVRCEHGSISLNTAARRHISIEACKILTELFPGWEPNSIDDESCSICEVMVSERKASRLESRKRAEEEKVKLKHMLDYAFDGDIFLLGNVSCALIPFTFLRSWRDWVKRPTDATRPDALDNTMFFCEHGMLNLDIEDIGATRTAAIIERPEWDYLETFYSACPLIALVQSGKDETPYQFNLPVCPECRLKRLSDWESIDLAVRISGKGSSAKEEISRPKTYGKARQSKRLRQIREHGEKSHVKVDKNMSVKDVKVALQDDLNIPTICQRLFLRGEELLDNEATIGSLRVLANDVFELREESESGDFSDSLDIPVQRNEGQGFGGTLLG